jgi:hypothetical protein
VDLNQSVFYRGLDLNHVETLVGEGKRRGLLLEQADYGHVPGVGYSEKRAQDDGFDATDVFLGRRTIELQGFVYGENVGDVWDRMQDLRSAITPSAAYLEAPGLDGYLPFQFYVPTQNLADFPGGYRQCQLNARPIEQPSFKVKRDTGVNGDPIAGQALAYSARLECKDPRVYLWPMKKYNFGGTSPLNGNVSNRGDYPAPLSFTFDVDAGGGAGNILFEVGGSRMRVTVEDTTAIQTYRYDGDLKVLTVEQNTIEVLRMDLRSFLSNTTYPKVPPGVSTFTITITGLIGHLSNAYMFWYEAFA